MTAEVIEGEAVEVKPEATRALVPQAHVVSGTGAMALLSDAEFARNLEIIKIGQQRADQVKLALLQDKIDFGSLPGISRPFLHQPGAEKFEKAYGLATSFVVDRHVGDGEESPDLEFIAHARIHVGDTAGPIVAEGIGEASSWETKYRYRTLRKGRTCPDCGKTTIIHLPAKPPARPGLEGRAEVWWCGKRDGGCGHTFGIADARITGQAEAGGEKVENPDPWDLANTLVKMACKRAHVAGILRATGTSGLFTQDEDSPSVRLAGGEQPQNGASAPATGQGGAQAVTAPSGVSQTIPDGPAGVQGVVSEKPDGIRMVHLSRPNQTGGPFEKLELRFKVANRQHTAMLIGDVARQVEALALESNQIVRVIGGEIEEVEWQPAQGTKPKKKELWGATAVAVLRDGEWWTSTGAAPRHGVPPQVGRPLAGPDQHRPAGRSTTDVPFGRDAGRGTGEAHRAASLGLGEAGPQPSPATPTPSALPSSAPLPPATAGASSSASTLPSSSSSSATTVRPVRTDGATGTVKATLMEPVGWTMKGKTAVGVIRAVEPDGTIIAAVLGDDPLGELAAQLGTADEPFVSTGDEVTMLGTWQKGWLILGAIGKATG